jgi:hypothetical protein
VEPVAVAVFAAAKEVPVAKSAPVAVAAALAVKEEEVARAAKCPL